VGLACAIAAAGAGVVVDSNEASVARALLDLLQRPEERRRMGLNGRRLVESSYAWERVARSLGERYGRITARATAS
jgi:glycosyltransferase involved in cell wall biosynthesis